MAEAERVLREISVVTPCTHFDLSLARAMPDRLPLDPGLDFVVHDDGMIELTEAGFRRMGQGHSADLDAAMSSAGRTRHWSAVSLYPSKFSDCPAGAVANSYPNVSLL